MKITNLTVDDFFPIIKQTLLDTFKVDSCLMYAPYSDIEKIDMGLRKMVWGTYSTSNPIFSLSEKSPYQITVCESTLHFYNIIITLNADPEPPIIAILPFRTEAINQAGVNRIMRENGIDFKHASLMYRIYLALPVIYLEELLLTLTHLITAFLPAFADHRVEYVSYTSEKHSVNPSEERFHSFSSEFVLGLHQRIEKCCHAITTGNITNAVDFMKSLLDYFAPFDMVTIINLRHDLSMMNSFICSRVFQTAVPPSYTLNLFASFDMRIHNTASVNALRHLPFEMARKYAILVKNYTYEKYSLLIRNVVNYIDQHLDHDLSLSVLAEEFGKNPSYLSNTFKKEVGETLTVYIGKQRVQASLRFFNTTDMTVAEVGAAVGISDFGYFSKLFKKYVGVSPREYKKMLDK